MSATTTTTADTPLAPSPTPTPESYTLPSAAALSRAAACTIKDEHGAALPFSALYAADGEKRNPGERTLAVFVRHFFCGVGIPRPCPFLSPCRRKCQEVLKMDAELRGVHPLPDASPAALRPLRPTQTDAVGVYRLRRTQLDPAVPRADDEPPP